LSKFYKIRKVRIQKFRIFIKIKINGGQKSNFASLAFNQKNREIITF